MHNLILHIGQGKTGTSSLQKFLYVNRFNLLNKNYFYLEKPNGDNLQFGHNHHVHNIYSGKQNVLLEQINNEINTVDKNCSIIVSSEEFWIFPERSFILEKDSYIVKNIKDQEYFIKKTFDFYSKIFLKIKIIVYLRRQDELISAWANQMSKRHLKYIATPNFIIEKNKLNLDYYNTVSLWVKYFGKNNVSIRVYEKDQISNTVEDFLNILQIDKKMLQEINSDHKTVNYSITLKAMLYRNELRKCTIDQYEWETLSYIMWELFKDERLGLDKEHSIMSYEEKMEIFNKYQNSNKLLAKQFLNKDTLFLHTPKKTIKPNLEISDIVEMSSKIFSSVLKKQIKKNEGLLSEENFNLIKQNSYQNSIIITFVNKDYMLLSDCWSQFMRNLEISNYIIVCLDAESFRFLKEKNPVIFLKNKISDIQELWKLRISLFKELIDNNISFIHSDVDALWLKNPLPKYIYNSNADVIFSQGTIFPKETLAQKQFVLCCGFFAIKANYKTKILMQELIEDIKLTYDDQISFNRVLLDDSLEVKNKLTCINYKKIYQNNSFTISFYTKKMSNLRLGINLELLPHRLFTREPSSYNTNCFIFHPVTEKKVEDKLKIFKKLNLI